MMSTKTAKNGTKIKQVKQTQQLVVSTPSPLQERILQQKKDLIEALWKHKGIIQTAVGEVGLSRATYYEYFNNDPAFKREALEAQEVALDHVEGKLHDLIDGVLVEQHTLTGEPVVYKKEPNVTATIFYLKTKGKKRGYVEKAENEIHINFNPIESDNFKCQRFIDTVLDIEKNGKRLSLDEAYEVLLSAEMGVEEAIKVRFVEGLRGVKQIG
jgi:ACT domain-containing protein